MKKEVALTHEFVEYIPTELKERTLYISVAFTTIVHKCCCGCGKEVVTPLSPADWSLVFDGLTISLNPSIGNWSFHCRSHYWIRRNQAVWASQWSDEMIEAGRKHEAGLREDYFNGSNSSDAPLASEVSSTRASEPVRQPTDGLWQRVKGLFRGN